MRTIMRPMFRPLSAVRRATEPSWLVICLLLTAAGCSEPAPPTKKDGIVEVSYIVARPTTVALDHIYTGRVVAHESAEVRPQVAGVIRRRLFTEGTLVEAGQPLYEIDPSLYRAGVDQAHANMQAAQAEMGVADELVERYRPLVEIEAVSKQELSNAVAVARRAKAAVAQTQAALDAARTSLRFSTVPAPLTGRIGRSLVTVGGLAAPGQALPLATIQQLDPIFVDVQQSATEVAALRRAIADKSATASHTQASIMLPDGTVYAHKGRVEFSEVVVDPTTGTVTLRIRVPNPDGLLLPGSFVRAQFAQSSAPSAFIVPQQAISRDATGQATLWVVDNDNKAMSRIVAAPHTRAADWIVTEGLKPGEKVIVQGAGKLRRGTALRPVAASNSAAKASGPSAPLPR